METAGQRLKNGRQLEGDAVERDGLTLGHGHPLGEAAVTVDSDRDALMAPVLEARATETARPAADVRMHADGRPVLEPSGELVPGNDGCRSVRGQLAIRRADRGDIDVHQGFALSE
jgi:hypothetical protein